MGLELHPLATLFPEMDAEQFDVLKASIEERGLLEPIVLYESKVLDGRNRLRACEETGIRVKSVAFDGDDPLAYVVAKNFARRHMTTSQRALVAGRIANYTNGGNRRSDQSKNPNSDRVTLEAAATLMRVNRATVLYARKVLKAAPELVRAVERGTITVEAAKALAVLPERDQKIIALTTDEKDRRAQIKKAKARAKEVRDRERDAAEAKPLILTSKREAKPAERTYTVDQWEKLEKTERQDIIAAGFDCQTKMNEQGSDLIEWARRSLNTVTGCEHDCPYCYARDIATSARMAAIYPNKFKPTFHPSRLAAPGNENLPEEARRDAAYRNVFANSMSDLFGKWVPEDWIEATIEMARRNAKWNFLVLTKFPQRAAEFDFPKNWWMGTTVDAQSRVANAEKAFERIKCGTKWLSVEPLLQPLEFSRLDLFQWIVIGGASESNKTPAWPAAWQQRFLDFVAPLHVAARKAGLSIYYKTNCGMRDELRIREFPWADEAVQELPKAFRYLKGL